jgi:hypothetical protein
MAAAEIVRTYVTDFNEVDRVERERRTRGVTFRELAHGYLEWLEKIRGAKPSTIRSHQSDLAEPGTPHKRGTRTTAGLIMAALGDRPASKITPCRGRGAPTDNRRHRRVGPQCEPGAGDRLRRVQLRHEADDVLAARESGPGHRSPAGARAGCSPVLLARGDRGHRPLARGRLPPSRLGHSQLTTTSRYLHARPAAERAAAFTAALSPSPAGGSAVEDGFSKR